MQFDLKKFLITGKKPWQATYMCDLAGRDFSGARVAEPVAVSFEAQPDGEAVHLTLRAKASVHGQCARCLDPVQSTESVEAEWVVEERDLDDPDFDLPLDGKGRLDVDEWLYQELLLQIPSVLLCSPDCQGLCPECGQKMAACRCQKPAQGQAAHAVDARLSVLQSLLNKDSIEEVQKHGST